MTMRYARTAVLLACLLIVPSVSAQDSLETAYASILRGDYQAGRSAIDRLAENRPTAEISRTRDWLASYEQIIAARADLRHKTFEWNVAQAREVLSGAGDDPHAVYLALNFAAQAAPYADDASAYAAEPWIRELTERCRAAARTVEEKDRWSWALGFYLLLERIHTGDTEIKAMSKRAERIARFQANYETLDALQTRIDKVNADLIRPVLTMIDRLYFETPDYRRMALAALDQLDALCRIEKLRAFMHGLANPDLREHFARQLERMRAEVADADAYSYRDVLKLWRQVAVLNDASIDVPEGLLVVEFIEGALGSLDEYTNMVWPSNAKEFDKIMRGSFEGVGIQLGVDERTHRLKVVTPLDGSPALEAGIQPDDLIVAVDGRSTAGWTTDDAVKNIMGPAGTEVVLTMQRPSTGETIPFKLKRRQIVISTVRGVERIADKDAWDYMLDKELGVAYVRLTGFQDSSAGELRAALEAARQHGMRGLILDVRHNPGGMLDVAVDVVSTFLERGTIVSTRGRSAMEQKETATGDAPFHDLPLAILVNDGSASASEILAGVLQDHKRAVVVGNRTFGKGSVQHVRQLSSDDARLKLTTALYYLPSGRSPFKADGADQWGVDADWEIKLTPKELRRVIERERESYVIRNGTNHEAQTLSPEEQAELLEKLKAEAEDDEKDPPLSEENLKRLDGDPYRSPNADPQLETALLLMRVKIAADMPWPREFVAARQE